MRAEAAGAIIVFIAIRCGNDDLVISIISKDDTVLKKSQPVQSSKPPTIVIGESLGSYLDRILLSYI